MKKLLMVVVLALVVVFAGKFYVEGRYKKELDKSIRLVSSYVDIDYSNVTIGFDGSLSVHDISVRKIGDAGSLTIKKLMAVSSDRFAPLRNGEFDLEEFPEWMNFSIESLRYDSVLLEPDTDEECLTFLTAYISSEIGLTETIANMSFKADFRDLTNIETVIDYKDQSSTMKMQFNFAFNDVLKVYSRQGALPFDNIRLTTWLDPSYASGFNDYCAAKLNMSVDDYLTNFVASKRYSVESFGLNLGEKFSKALVVYMKGGKDVVFSAHPSDLLKKTESIEAYSVRDLIRLLNLKMSLDGKSVALDLRASDTTTDEKDISGFWQNLFKTEDSESADLPKEEKNVAPSAKRAYSAEPVNTLPNFINSYARIWRKGEKVKLEGLINGYSQGVVSFEIRKFGGQAIYKIPLNDIRKLEVYQ